MEQKKDFSCEIIAKNSNLQVNLLICECFSLCVPVMWTGSRLLHYFRGHHHLEEIMYNENMRRSHLKTLFDKFRSVLVVTNHEDPVISIFQSPLD